MPDTALPQQHALLDAIRGVVGERGLLVGDTDTAGYIEDWRRLYHGRTPAVIRPGSTDELARVVRLCAEARVPIRSVATLMMHLRTGSGNPPPTP